MRWEAEECLLNFLRVTMAGDCTGPVEVSGGVSTLSSMISLVSYAVTHSGWGPRSSYPTSRGACGKSGRLLMNQSFVTSGAVATIIDLKLNGVIAASYSMLPNHLAYSVRLDRFSLDSHNARARLLRFDRAKHSRLTTHASIVEPRPRVPRHPDENILHDQSAGLRSFYVSLFLV